MSNLKNMARNVLTGQGSRPGKDGSSGRSGKKKNFQGSTQYTGMPAGVAPVAPEIPSPINPNPGKKRLGGRKTGLGG